MPLVLIVCTWAISSVQEPRDVLLSGSAELGITSTPITGPLSCQRKPVSNPGGVHASNAP